MSKRRVCVVVTARPSYSRVKTALRAICDHPDLELQLVVAASALLDRYGRVEEQIERDGFQIDSRVYMVLEGENPMSMAKTTGLGVIEMATAFNNLRPDIVVTIADRYETLATAVAATYMGLPLAHIQGGEVTGSIDERVRHAITKLADLHLPATRLAADRIVRMGEDPSVVHVTGCPSIDLAAKVKDTGSLSFNPFEHYGGVGADFDLDDGYIVVMQHPVTTEYADARSQVDVVLRAVHASGHNALWFWPNVDAGADGTSRGIRVFREMHHDVKIRFFKNMAPAHFLELLLCSKAIVGNSSVAIRECEYLGVPAVNIGSRQAGRERGENVLDVDFDLNDVLSAINIQSRASRFPSAHLYGDGRAGERIAEVLASQTPSPEKRLMY
jgi:UDP-hydrolysing UDP-N-acetyl-D-glucosamine 2-epimerase